MKTVATLFVFAAIASCQPGTLSVTPAGTYAQQEGIVRINVASRGLYQYVLRAGVSDQAPAYLVTNFPDSLFSYIANTQGANTEARVIFSGAATGKTDSLYTPNPNDTYRGVSVLPTLTLTAIKRKL